MTKTELITYINTYIENSAVEAFTNLRLQTALLEIVNDAYNSSITDAANTTALQALSGANYTYVIVTGVGIFKYSSTGTANGSTIFNATGGGTWNLIFTGGSTISQLSAPSITLTVGGTTDITIDWTAVTNAYNYILQRATVSDYSDATTIYSGNLLTYYNTGLTENTTYYYRVKAQGFSYLDSNYDTDSATTNANLYDADAQIYFNAIAAASGTITDAKKLKVSDLFTGLKSNSLYNKIKALYLYHGNNLTAASYNALNPTAVLGSFKIDWTGTPTLNANGGFTPASGKYGNTNFHPDGGGLTSTSGAGMGFYCDGSVDAAEYTMGLYQYFQFSPGQGNAMIGGTNIVLTGTTGSGFHFISREPASTTCKSYRNATVITTAIRSFVGAYSANTSGSYSLVGGMKEHPSTVYPSVTPVRVSLFTEGLLAAEVTILNTLIQNYIA